MANNNRIRSLIILIGIILLIISILGAIVYYLRRGSGGGARPDSTTTITTTTTTVGPDRNKIIPADTCPRPKLFSSNYDFDYTKRPNEYRKTDVPVDFFRLSISWSPTFCENQQHQNSFQCQHKFGFVVHGLWPNTKHSSNNVPSSQQHPRNCRNEAQLPTDLVHKYFCLMPSEYLIQGEWEKHGTCYWNKPEDYFERIQTLFSKLKLPNDFSDIFNDPSIPKTSRRNEIKQRILSLNPQLTSKQIDVQVGGNGKKLREIAFCYDLNFNHINCY